MKHLLAKTTAAAADIKIQAEEILKAKKMINEILSHHTGQSIDKIAEETEILYQKGEQMPDLR